MLQRLSGRVGRAARTGASFRRQPLCQSTRSVASKEAITRCGSGYSIEVTPNTAKKVDDFAAVAGLSAGTTVNVTFLPGADIEETIGICKRLHVGGMHAVAHCPARAFKDLKSVEDYFARLKDVGCREVLVLGGGAAPVGSVDSSMEILESGLIHKYDFARVGVAAHPEGHPDVKEDIMVEALLRKAEWASANGIDLYYETQFCFEAKPIVEWEQLTRQRLIDRLGRKDNLPGVCLGIAGPAKISALIKFSLASGVGNSIRFVKKYTGNLLKLATTATPHECISGIAAHQATEPDTLIRGLHYYSFGGLVSTLRFANSVSDGNFDTNSEGFDVRS